jgi:hypothetical protein
MEDPPLFAFTYRGGVLHGSIAARTFDGCVRVGVRTFLPADVTPVLCAWAFYGTLHIIYATFQILLMPVPLWIG